VNGKQYAGWKRASITRGIEAIAGSFELEVSDRWIGQDQPWPIAEEDECEVAVGRDVLITGYVDRCRTSYSSDEYTLGIQGRDRTGDLVDCSADLGKWEFKNIPLLTLAKRVAEPFGIAVSLQLGVIPPAPPAKFSVDPGDTTFDVIDRACRLAGLLPVSDGRGGLVLTRSGSERVSTALIEGENILAAESEFDATNRFRTYRVLGQHKGTDDFSGTAAASVKGSAADENVRRSARVLLVRPEGNVTSEYARKRAEWEAIVRAARADAVTVTVQGWTQGNGDLWPVNKVVIVRSPRIRVNGEMLISQVTYKVDDESGTTTELTLRRPDAFKPQPTVTKASSGLWKEIARGV
jgi:prophage tail gpP-like protein